MIAVVTNRLLCSEPFLLRIERIAREKPDAIILREKDMADEDYYALARECKQICEKHQVKLIINTRISIAKELGLSVHLPMRVFEEHHQTCKNLPCVGVSVHSVEEATLAQSLGANYLMAGHIFPTDCKRDLAARGVAFLGRVCQSVSIPVYAIGGLTPKNIKSVITAGASGACIMSSAMQHNDPRALFQNFSAEIR